ncbi:MAG: MutT/NUDIX family protein [Micavibrio sp.]|nr:MutT/NUDIX family protein [Micavibrio sp.]
MPRKKPAGAKPATTRATTLAPLFRNAALNPGGEFELAMNVAQMDDILLHKTRDLVLDPQNSYDRLSPANQTALRHPVRAAIILNDVFLKQDHRDNIQARNILEAEAATGHPAAIKALSIFTMQNGVEGNDMYALKTEPLPLFKNKKVQQGRNFYPQNITRDEVVTYIASHPEQASALLGNNTIVQRDNADLTAVPYSVAFAGEMKNAACELLAAARETDHAGFAEYLRWHAQALVNDSDPEAMYRADKAWVNLKDSPLDFTIGRETYADTMSKDVSADPAVAPVLALNGIKAKAKDSFGTRVGIVNKDSDGKIMLYRKYLDAFKSKMPLYSEYADTGPTESLKMTFADVDLVVMSGSYAAVRGGVTLANNLPNSDKLATQLNEGGRLTFHRQVRQSADPAQRQSFLDTLIDPAQHAMYDEDGSFLFTIGHEFAHTLGPRDAKDGRDKKSGLGKNGDIIEENKADMGSLVMTDYLVEQGAMSGELANIVYLTWASRGLLTKEPAQHEAHRIRSVMQMNYFREQGAIEFEAEGRLRIVPEKIAPVARRMLEDVIALQLEGDAEKAQDFVSRYAVWNEAMQYGAAQQMKFKPKLYKMLQQPMRDKLAL